MERRGVRIFLILLAAVIALAVIGWLGFMIVEGKTPGEALSATINVLSMVGLGTFPARSWQGYILVGLLEFGAVSIVAAAIATLSQFMISGTLRQYLGRYRMDERIGNLTNHFIVVGYSLTGESLLKDLRAEGQPFVVIERNPDVVTILEEKNLLFVEGDATDEKVLRKAGIDHARGLFAVLSNDSDNLMVVLSARGLNDKLKIVSRSTREDYVQRFQRAGADAAISPQEWASRRMIQAVLRPNLLDLLSTLLDPTITHAYLDESQVPLGSPAVGKSLRELNIRGRTEIVILGIARSDGERICSPGADAVVRGGDVLIGFGQRQNFSSLASILRGESPAPLPAQSNCAKPK
jgi:voltage-gated potassium channel